MVAEDYSGWLICCPRSFCYFSAASDVIFTFSLSLSFCKPVCKSKVVVVVIMDGLSQERCREFNYFEEQKKKW